MADTTRAVERFGRAPSGRGECRARWVGVTSRPECARAARAPALRGPRVPYALRTTLHQPPQRAG